MAEEPAPALPIMRYKILASPLGVIIVQSSSFTRHNRGSQQKKQYDVRERRLDVVVVRNYKNKLRRDHQSHCFGLCFDLRIERLHTLRHLLLLARVEVLGKEEIIIDEGLSISFAAYFLFTNHSEVAVRVSCLSHQQLRRV